MEFSPIDQNCREKYYKNGKPKLSFFVPKSNIYMYLGHGADVVDAYGNPDIKIVPENCIYITQAVCGLETTLPFEIFEAFANPAYENIWREPHKHMDKLSKIMDHPALHIHLPGCEYVDNTFYPLSDDVSNPYREKTKPWLQLSGLVSLQDAQSIPKEEVEKIFEGQKYNLGTMKNQYDSGSLKIKKEELMSYFKYSTYPKLVVSDEPFGHPEDTVPLRTIKEFPEYTQYALFRDKVMRKKITASELMKRYPGIHFNLLCRFIPSHLNRTPQLMRRRYSAAFQNSAVGTLIKSMRHKGRNENVATLAYNFQESLESQPMNVLRNLKAIASNSYTDTANVLNKIIRRKTMKNRGLGSKATIGDLLIDSIQKGETEFVKEQVMNLPRDWIQSRFGAELVRYAFLEHNRSLLKFLCKLGAPSDLAFREFTNFKNTRPSRKNLMKARVLLASSCSNGVTRKNGKN